MEISLKELQITLLATLYLQAEWVLTREYLKSENYVKFTMVQY
jgi:hypothetical protein